MEVALKVSDVNTLTAPLTLSHELIKVFVRLRMGDDGLLYDRRGDNTITFTVKEVGGQKVLTTLGGESEVVLRWDSRGLTRIGRRDVDSFLDEAFLWV